MATIEIMQTIQKLPTQIQTIQQLQQTQSQILTSSAFPQNKQIKQTSIFHKILKRCKQPTTNITMRLTNKQSDIREIWNFQLQWFPLSYSQNFYNRILQGHYRCLVTQTEVMIQERILKEILLENYNIQKQKYDVQLKRGFDRNPTFIKPSSYFIQQGIHLFEPAKDKQTNHFSQYAQFQNINYVPQQIPLPPPRVTIISQKSQKITKLRIIIGVMVFDLTNSKGYLRSTWWQQNLFGARNSIYINTIGVMFQFRKNGIARKMIQWLIQRTGKDKIFKFVYLHVIQYNIAAIKLYEKLGFKQLASQDNYYYIDGKPYTGKMLGLFINGGMKSVRWGEWFSSFWK